MHTAVQLALYVDIDFVIGSRCPMHMLVLLVSYVDIDSVIG